MKTKKILSISMLFLSIHMFSQQISDGHAPIISEFNAPLKSGIYQGSNPLGITPDNSATWQYLLVMRNNTTANNYQLQIASSFANNDRLFFRKIDNDASTSYASWIELATRGNNNFVGNQNIAGNISTTGNVGIGTSTPEAKLDVKGTIKSYESTPLGAVINSSQLINESGAKCGTTTGNKLYNRLWMFRDNASSTDWLTARLHDGISIDVSFGSPQVDTKTWWERDPYDNIQSWGNAAETYVTINKGNVGIGTIAPDSKLTVAGNIHSREVKVTVDAGADFVFDEDYVLPSLDSVENYIKENKHLPEIASAKEMQTNGLNLSEMNIKLLQKIEELTLYMIEQNKAIEILKKEIKKNN